MSLSIYSRAMLLIGASLAFITFLVGLHEFRRDRAVLIDGLERRLAAQTAQHANAVSESLWNLNRESARTILQSATHDPDFLWGSIVDELGRVFVHVGEPIDEADTAASKSISGTASIVSSDGSPPIGVLVLSFSLKRMHHLQRQTAVNNSIKTALQLLAVLVATAIALRAVVKPLSDLTDRMIAVAWGDLHNEIPHVRKRDQIGKVARAVEIFRDSLLQRRGAEEALRHAHDELERRVAERTRALSESERRLRGIMDSVADSIITVDEQGAIQSANLSTEKIFGYSSRDLRELRADVLVPAFAREPIVIGGGHEGGPPSHGASAPREIEGVRKDRKGIPLEITAAELHLGETRHFVVVLRDISERKEAQLRLQQAQKMETVGQLTGGIAHDFNNLLVVVLGNLELLMEDVDDEDSKDRIQTVMHAAQRGADLTKRLLAFSRQQPLAPRVVDIGAVAGEMKKFLRQSIGETIDIRMDLAADLWPTLVDPHQLENALLNLAVNARDAMPHGGTLIIETTNAVVEKTPYQRPDAIAGEYVVLSVRDTGCGMPPEVAERAFEPFFSTKAPGKGTGLGLSMIYGFVKQSNGDALIESHPGLGTTVRLYFPRSIEKAAHIAAPVASDLTPRGKETILVNEDDEMVRAFVVKMLKQLGYNVKESATVRSALAELESHGDIDLVFTDVVMPGGMTGFDLAKVIADRFPKVKVLVTSGYNSVQREPLALKALPFIAKPYARAALAKKVRAVLDS